MVEKKDDSKPKEKKTDLLVGGVKVASVPAKSVEKSTQQVAPPSSTTKPREMEPREMIKKLYDMGYRIENNKLVCYQKVLVKIDDIINNGES